MRVQCPVSRWARAISLAAFCLGLASSVSAQAGPAFSTQAPISGIVGSTFTVFLPVFNTGAADAANVLVTSVALGHMAPTNLSLPQSIGTLVAGDHHVLDLGFDAGVVSVGANYLLTVRGTYQAGTQTLGFALNRFVGVSIPSDSTATLIQHWIVLDEALAEANSLPGLDPVADQQTMLNSFRSHPEFIDSGIDVPSSSVWATFANGEALIFGNDRNPYPQPHATSILALAATNYSPKVSANLAAPTDTTPGSGKLPSELPASSAVSLRNTLPRFPFGDADLIHDLEKMLSPQNYQVTKPDASVDLNGSLRSAGGDGVFYITSHGGFHKRAGTIWDYGIWTSTKADAWMDARLPTSDVFGTPLTPPTLIHMMALAYTDPAGNDVYETHYAFTSSFVRKYFSNFSNASLAYIDACGSDDPRLTAGQDAQDLKRAFLDKNASVYVGWSATVDDGISTDSARLVFDRLLGANQFFLETGATPSGEVFKQRPFDWQSTVTDLPKHSLGLDADFARNTLAVLKFTQNSSLDLARVFGLLAPSIDQVEVDEAGTLTPPNNFFITGLFGSDLPTVTVGGDNPSKGTTATTGGRELSSCADSEPDIVKCGDLSPSGDGSAGNVQVSVRGHNSNIAQLTYWQGPFQFIVAGEDTLKQTVNFNVAFRQDIRLHRPVIHNPPVEPSSSTDFPIQAIYPVSTASYSCTGTGVYVTPLPGVISETFTWTGGGTLPLFQGRNVFFTDGFALEGTVVSHTALLLYLTAGTLLTPGCQYMDVILSTSGTTTTVPDVLPVLTANFISALKVTLDPDSAAITSPNPPPSGAAPCLILITNPCQATMNWSEIMPLANTQPDPMSAR